MFNHYKNLFATKSFELLTVPHPPCLCILILYQLPAATPMPVKSLFTTSSPSPLLSTTQHNRQICGSQAENMQWVVRRPGKASLPLQVPFHHFGGDDLHISSSLSQVLALRRFFPLTVSCVKSPMLCICNSNGRCSATPDVSLEGSGTHFHTAELTGCRTGRPVSWCSQRGTSLQRLPWQCAFPPPNPSACLQPSVSPAGTRTHSLAQVLTLIYPNWWLLLL